MYSSSEKNILLIVEGAKREPKLMRRLFESFGLADDYQIVPVEINVHDFLDKLFQEYDCDFDGLELVDFVADLLPDKRKAARLLETNFTDTLLIFDLDPQDNRHDFKRLQNMQDYYCDSTDMGQLFLNYPSIEAYRDFDPLKYPSLEDAVVPPEVISGHPSYKEWVARRGDSLADIGRLDVYSFAGVIAVHAVRALGITNEQKTDFDLERVDDLAEMAAGVNHSVLLNKEINRLNRDMLCACSTCLFFIANWPKRLNDIWGKGTTRGLGIRLF